MSKNNRTNKYKNNDPREVTQEPMSKTSQTQVQQMTLREGCSNVKLNYPVNGCLTTILMILLLVIAGNEVKRSKIRLECDKIKMERLKQDKRITFDNDTMSIITPDTLKIGNFQKTYIPLLKMYQDRQKD